MNMRTKVSFYQFDDKNSNNILYNETCDALVYEYFPDGQPRPDETPFVFFTSNKKSTSFSGSRQDFIGFYRDLKNPVAVEQGSCGNKELKGGEAMFSMSFDVDLQAEKREDVNIYLGTLGQDEDIATRLQQVKSDSYADDAFAYVKGYWTERRSRFQVNVADEASRMMNVWNPLQAFVNFHVCREISFYATGTVRGWGYAMLARSLITGCPPPVRNSTPW